MTECQLLGMPGPEWRARCNLGVRSGWRIRVPSPVSCSGEVRVAWLSEQLRCGSRQLRPCSIGNGVSASGYSGWPAPRERLCSAGPPRAWQWQVAGLAEALWWWAESNTASLSVGTRAAIVALVDAGRSGILHPSPGRRFRVGGHVARAPHELGSCKSWGRPGPPGTECADRVSVVNRPAGSVTSLGSYHR